MPSDPHDARDDALTLHAIELDDSYHVERVLADGPSSRTELVTLDGLGPLVRKRIPRELANPEAWARLTLVEEPLLPHVEGMYSLPDAFVVVSDYVEGQTLAEHVTREGALPPREAVGVLVDVAHAANVLHSHDVVHRDITPSNVVLAADGAHLIDLGIARLHTRDMPHDTTRMGTWGFASPEQFGFAQTDARSDVYSLGRLLAFMLTGLRPDEPSFEGALANPSRVPGPLRSVILRACEFEPSSRPQGADELAREAQDALGQLGRVAETRQTGRARLLPREATGDAARFDGVGARGDDGPATLVSHTQTVSERPGPSVAVTTSTESTVQGVRILLRDDVSAPLPRRVWRILTSWRAWAVLLAVLWGAAVSWAGVMAAVDPSIPPTTMMKTIFYYLAGGSVALFWGILPTREMLLSLLHLGLYSQERGRRVRLAKGVALLLLKGLGLVAVFSFALAAISMSLGLLF
jgi:hypothetical protein